LPWRKRLLNLGAQHRGQYRACRPPCTDAPLGMGRKLGRARAPPGQKSFIRIPPCRVRYRESRGRASSQGTRGVHPPRYRGLQTLRDRRSAGSDGWYLQGPAPQGQKIIEGGAWTMNCTDTLGLLDDAADGELTPTMMDAVESHIGSCDACRAEKEALDSLL